MSKLRVKHPIAAFLATTALSTPIHAQIAVSGTLPVVMLQDANGVDLKSGQLVRNSGTISIGPKDNPVLSTGVLSTFANSGDGTPITAGIYRTCAGAPSDGCFNEIKVRIGAKEYNFGFSGVYPATSPLGARLETNTSGYLMTDENGTQWQFNSVAPNGANQIGFLQWAKLKSGEKLTYYRNGGAIVSNRGYQLRSESSSTYYIINMAVDYCDPSATICSNLTINWPKLYSDGSGILDSLNRKYTTSLLADGTGSVTSPEGVYYKFQRTSSPVSAPPGCIAILKTDWVETAVGRTNYSYTIDCHGKITDAQSTRPSGGSVHYHINAAPEGPGGPGAYTATITDELGHITTPNFDKQSSPNSYWPTELRLSSVQYPESNSVQMGRDARARLTSVQNTPKPSMGTAISSTAGYTDCANWIACREPDYTIDLRGNRTDYTYDPTTGLLLTKSAPADSSNVRPVTRYAYEQRQAVYKNASGQLVSSGEPIWVLRTTKTCRTTATVNGVCQGGSADEVVTTYDYDGNLLPTTETTASGDGSVSSTITRTYDAVGNVVYLDGPLPGDVDKTRYYYDAMRQLTAEIGPDPDGASGPLPNPATRYTYNGDGQIKLVEHGTAAGQSDTAPSSMAVLDQVATHYDNVGRRDQETRSAGGSTYAITQFSYDLDSRLVCTAVRMNPAAFSTLPSDACTLGPQGNDGPDRITRNVYDDYHAGLLMKVQKAYGVTTANGFPATLQEDYASYTYTLNGKQQTVTDANGNVATYAYDGFDRQVAWRFPSAANGAVSASCNIGTITEVNGVSGPSETRNSTDDCEKYAYDRNGNRATLIKRDGSIIRYAYDALNRVTSKCVTTTTSCVVPDATRGRDVYYKYDLGGRQLSASFDSASGADKISSDYDALGRLTSSTISMGGFTKALGSTYDCAGRRVQLTHPDTQAFSYAYDASNRLTEVSEGTGSMAGCAWTGAATKLDTFAYNSDGTLASRTEGVVSGPTATVSYTWDGIGRLTNQTDAFPSASASNVSWAFTTSDPARKLNPANQIVNESRDNDAYAWRGAFAVNRNYQVNGLNQYSAAGTASFTYDPNGNLIGDGTNTFLYDAENRLVSATAGGTTTNLTYDPSGRLWRVQKGSADTRFLYDGDALVAEYDSSGNLINRYVHGSNAAADDPLVWYVGSGTGTKRYLHADHLGSIVAMTNTSGAPSINTYDEYGIPGTNNAGRFQYTGQAWLPELGMYHYKARVYSPTLGRFLQTDPIGYVGGINLYEYVQDDPIDRIDPTGEIDWKRVGQFAYGAGEAAVGVAGIVAGAAGDAASGTAELASGGTLTPLALPAAVVSTGLMVGGAGLASDGLKNMAGAILNNNNSSDPNAADRRRGNEQRERRAERRETQSRQGPDGARDARGNPQKPSGEGSRYAGRQEANKGPSGQRPKGPDRRYGRERNVGIDEEHSMKPKGQQSY
jgi:RHS repeat-associated protein